MKTFSLTKRVIALSSAWTIIAIALLGWLLLMQFRAGAERNFAELQKAQLYSLIGSVSLSDDFRRLNGAPNLGDTSFLVPESGWFWRVSLLNAPEVFLESRSADGVKLARPPQSAVPYNDQFERSFIANAAGDKKIRVYESEIDLGNNSIALFQVAGNQTEFDSDINRFALRTGGFLAVFGFGVVALNVLILLFGLKPLDRIRLALSDIREGRSSMLEGTFPAEIAPMVSEMNVLILNNRQTVERARTQVGNLAHSLKTPIAVLTNEASSGKPVAAKIVSIQTKNMQSQVQHYLNRARIAAQAGTSVFQTDAVAAAKRLTTVMQKLAQEKEIVLSASKDCPRFAGEKEDFEEILGNLVENACKWGTHFVEVKLSAKQGAPDAGRWLQLIVSDDGPGIAEKDHATALSRGQRLDEETPGTGLGLSIVYETVSAYGGTVALGKAAKGGLEVVVLLPAVRTNV